jgi:hypothetical protein
VVIQSQRSIKLDGDDWGELCDNESRVEADEVTRRVDTCARRSARCRWQPPARHLSLLQFFLLHTKYFELFYLKLKKVILPCYLWPIETPLVKRHGPSVDTSALILAVLPYPGREIR